MIKERRPRIILLVIMLTVLLSCFSIGAVYAKYYSRFDGNGIVSTAKWDVAVEGNPTNIFLTEENKTASFEFTVESTSDVSVSYKVLLTLPNNTALPSGVTFTLSRGQENILAIESNGVYTFADDSILILEPSATGNSHTLTLKVTATDFNTDVSIEGIDIKVEFTQVAPQ